VNKRNIRNKITVIIKDDFTEAEKEKRMKDEESETKEKDGNTQISSAILKRI
jgi:hypothetical protein